MSNATQRTLLLSMSGYVRKACKTCAFFICTLESTSCAIDINGKI